MTTSLRPADNPFNAQRIESIPFIARGVAWAELVARLERAGRRGAIVGPHGSGKTTLLDRLEVHFTSAGHEVMRAELRAESPRLPRSFTTAARGLILLLDGADRLGPLGWIRLARRTRSAEGLVVTSHRPGHFVHRWAGVPTLVETSTSAELLATIVRRLAPTRFRDFAPELPSLLEAHGGNVRTALRALYDRCATAPPRSPGDRPAHTLPAGY